MAKYIREEDVRIRLIGKVRFTENEEDENKMHVLLLRRLINEAESQVHVDLSNRYAIPFQTIDGRPFSCLPEYPSRDTIRTLCELKACIRVLGTDYGRGSAASSEAYTKELKESYKEIYDKLIEKKKFNGEELEQWKFPPMLELRLAPHNYEADDGYMGQILVTSMERGDYPAKQINSPGENFWNGQVDE